VSEVNPIRRFLFNKAYSAKEEALKKGLPPPSLWEKLVFSKLRDRFGGRIRFGVSGSAPLSAVTASFLKVCFAEMMGEGYGLTETCATGTSTDAEDVVYGHVGSVSPCVEMKLVDVPDMNYYSTDEPEPRGEVWLRGASIFGGYYKSPDKTNEVLFKDGWFATGDVGKWRLDGKLQIIDRKKNIFKLAQGEYIRPEYIENIYKLAPLVGNIFVHGDSDQTYLVAIVYPDPEVLKPWARQNGLAHLADNFPKLCQDPKVRNAIKEDMERISTREKLTGFEKVKRFTVVPEDFTIENGMLTSTLKLKRASARDRYLKEIKEMYTQAAASKL